MNPLIAQELRRIGEAMPIPFEVVFADDNAVQQIQQLFAYIRAPEGVNAAPAGLLLLPT